MKENLARARSWTKEDIKRAACLSLHTYDGATASEWQEQADALREGDGGDETRNEDANVSQMIADALRELDESCVSQSGSHVAPLKARSAAVSGTETSIQLARLWAALGDVRSRIDNEVIPLGMHLGLENPELMQALEAVSERIREHFGHWHLIAERRRDINSTQ